MSSRRGRAGVLALGLALAVTGCSAATGPRVGADVRAAGPHDSPVVAVPTGEASAAPAAGTSHPVASPTSLDLQVLGAALAQALAADDPLAAGSLRLDQRPAAQNQILVTWTTSTDPDDPAARTRVRQEAVTILATIHDHPSTYGSVLLTAIGAVRDASGHKVVTKVVRAKYSHALVDRTDFHRVPVDTVFALPDDKPAEISPSFR
jgi:hypothetical protein